MTNEEWKKINDEVTSEMLDFTRVFVTPLGTETYKGVRLVGSGSYISFDGKRLLLTCEHVACQPPIHYRFHSSEDVFEYACAWRMNPYPIDAAMAQISDTDWNATTHNSDEIPTSKFAFKHAPTQKEELLFFCGFAGENSHYGFEIHEANATGHCSQEVADSGDSQIFEIFWKPEKLEFTSKTDIQTRKEIKKDDPRGFSGSLVWNTRYLEVTNANQKWSPENAVVTGLLCRWDEGETGNLLALRVEHLNKWLRGSR